MSPQPRPNTDLPDATNDSFFVPLCAVFRQHLKGDGLKFTPERAKILDAVIQMERVFEADELLYEMRRRANRVSKATIYRTLKLLVEAGIVEQVLYDPKMSHYRLAYGKPSSDQMVCVETGRTIEFTAPELQALRDRIAAEHGWSPVGHRMLIYAISTAEEDEPPKPHEGEQQPVDHD